MSLLRSYLEKVDRQGIVDPFNYRLLSVDPLVIYVTTARYIKNLHFMSKILDEHEVVYVVGWSWAMESPHRIRFLKRETKTHKRVFKNHRIVFIGNNEKSTELIRSFGMDSCFVNKNCFLAESLYHVIPNADKTCDRIGSCTARTETK